MPAAASRPFEAVRAHSLSAVSDDSDAASSRRRRLDSDTYEEAATPLVDDGFELPRGAELAEPSAR